MKIYLLIMLIGALLTAVHFTSGPEKTPETLPQYQTRASHRGFDGARLKLRQRQGPLSRQYSLGLFGGHA